MPTLILVRGDKNYYVEFEVLSKKEEPIDLSDSTVRFKAQKYGENTLTIDKPGIILDQTENKGVCRVKIEEELLTKEGEFSAELEFEWVEPGVVRTITIPGITLKVVKDLPK